MTLAELAARLVPGARIEVRATPKARRNAVEPGESPDAPVRVWVTAAPEDGKANEAVRKLLAKALGIAPGRLRLVRGATSRDKAFQLD